MTDDIAPILATPPAAKAPAAPAAAAAPARRELTPQERLSRSSGDVPIVDDAQQSVVHYRKEDGSVGIRDRTAADDAPEGTQAVAGEVDPATPRELSFKDGKVVFGEMEFAEPDLRAMLERHALEDSRRATLPDAPEKYEATLPKDFKVPEGIEFKLRENDPALFDAQRWAHANGIGQEKFSELISLYAADKIREATFIREAGLAERNALGANGTMRVTAVQGWIRGIVGDELAGPMSTMLVSEKIVRGFEKIMHQSASQGAASFSQAHRDASPQGTVTDEKWATMSAREKQEYSQSHDQTRFQTADGRHWQEPARAPNNGRRFG
jgi:hypothetical protein